MEERQILWIIKLLPAVSAILVMLLFFALRAAYHPQQLILKTDKELTGLLRERKKKRVWYQRTEKWLLKKGAPFHCDKSIDPIRFLAMRLIVSGLGLIALSKINIWCGLVVMTVLFYMPVILLEFLNWRDNRRMLPELKIVCHTLAIQIQSGVYVTDALSECYGGVQERRLRKALLGLAADIVMKADIHEVLSRFQRSFDNRYIDSLCAAVLQALESGQTLALLDDISEQIKDMEEAVIARSIIFYRLGIVTAVMGITLYIYVTYLFVTAAE